MNPLDEALEAIDELEKDAAQWKRTPMTPRQQKELEMWQQWDQSGRKPEQLRPLVKSLQPLVRRRSRIYETKVRDIPPDAIRAEFQDQLLHGLETYDPNRGKLGTHVSHQLMKANRFITTYQNPARIQGERAYAITKVRNATEALEQQLGRVPTAAEIASKAMVPLKDVRALEVEIRPTIHTGRLGEANPTFMTPSKTNEMLRLLPQELTSDENLVFGHVYGLGGKKALGTGDIAKRLHMSAPKVSRLRSAIAKKWREYE